MYKTKHLSFWILAFARHKNKGKKKKNIYIYIYMSHRFSPKRKKKINNVEEIKIYQRRKVKNHRKQKKTTKKNFH